MLAPYHISSCGAQLERLHFGGWLWWWRRRRRHWQASTAGGRKGAAAIVDCKGGEVIVLLTARANRLTQSPDLAATYPLPSGLTWLTGAEAVALLGPPATVRWPTSCTQHKSCSTPDCYPNTYHILAMFVPDLASYAPGIPTDRLPVLRSSPAPSHSAATRPQPSISNVPSPARASRIAMDTQATSARRCSTG